MNQPPMNQRSVNRRRRTVVEIATFAMVATTSFGVMSSRSNAQLGGGGDDAKKKADAAAGKALVKSLTCAVCHGDNGQGATGPSWWGIWGKDVELEGGKKVKVDAAYVKESIKKPSAKIVKGYKGVAMPTLKVTDDQITKITAFIEQLGKLPPKKH